ncbi:MAG: LemA family protein [Spirochaetia bacterium]|nr:LemA family protein [Spirochaetia bacterium]
MELIIGAGIILLLIILYMVFLYNGLVRWRNRVTESWSDIETQMQRRYDLIPNLVNTVKGYAAHEKSVLEGVTSARANAVNNHGTPAEQAKSENMLSDTLKSLFAVAEAYPDLKANQNFIELQRELTDTEDKIQASRRFYNGNVMSFNTKQEVFPNNIFAGMLGFKKSEFFELDNEAARKPVEVKF